MSPIKRLTILGTTSPINGMLPTVTTTSEVISDTIISPDHKTAVRFSPRLTLTESPSPAIVNWSAIR